MDVLLVALPALALLACPLMMVVCVLAMRRMGHDGSGAAEVNAPATREEHIGDLQRQLQAIQVELARLEAEQPLPVATGASRAADQLADEVAVGVGYAERQTA